jgi:iron complex transport system substrate-binding protein
VEAGAFPVTIEHEFGSTTVESEPKRVVTVGLTDQDAVLAVGVVPVATTNWFGTAPGRIFPWAKDKLADATVPQVLEGETEFEKVAALKPDLILALYAGITDKDYKLLSAIAPTIGHPKGEVNYAITWQEQTEIVGRALGRPAAAKEMVAATEQVITDTAAGYPDLKGKTGAVVTPYEGIFVYAPEDPRGRLLTSLGMTYLPALADVAKDEFGASISVEKANLMNDAAAVIWFGSKDQVATAVPTFPNLDVAKRGGAIYVEEDNDDPFYISTSFITVLSLPFLLENLAPKLSAAVDGDPSTSTDS